MPPSLYLIFFLSVTSRVRSFEAHHSTEGSRARVLLTQIADQTTYVYILYIFLSALGFDIFLLPMFSFEFTGKVFAVWFYGVEENFSHQLLFGYRLFSLLSASLPHLLCPLLVEDVLFDGY
jgi:hypothetical protein